MKLSADQALARLVAHDHGVLGTLHADRGVDLVPVVYAVTNWGPTTDTFVGVPIDRVKPKASTRLQRHRNLEADPRATLLVDHWDRDNWSQLWWVRAELLWQADAALDLTEQLASELGERYHQYQDQPFEDVLVLRVVNLSGWSAS